MDKSELEEGVTLAPRYDSNGLICAVVTDACDGSLLMVAWMNAEALRLTLETRQVHFFSRSRKKIWRKGEQSGHIQKLVEARIDCDQDTLWLKVDTGGKGQCHVGYPGCFYRKIDLDSRQLKTVESRSYDPQSVYRST